MRKAAAIPTHLGRPLYRFAFKRIPSLSLRRSPRRTPRYACVGSSLPPRSPLECKSVLPFCSVVFPPALKRSNRVGDTIFTSHAGSSTAGSTVRDFGAFSRQAFRSALFKASKIYDIPDRSLSRSRDPLPRHSSILLYLLSLSFPLL